MVTRKFLEFQKRRLLRKHEALGHISVSVSPLDVGPVEDAGAFISSSWRRAYGDRISIRYSGEFLRFNAGVSRNRGIITTAVKDGEMCGCCLGLPVDFLNKGTPIHSTILTGLCTLPEFEGQGLAEMMMIEHGLALIEAGHPFGVYWRAGKETEAQKPAASKARTGHSTCFPLHAKALMPATAGRLGKLPLFTALLGRGLYLAFRPNGRLPAGFEMEPYESGHAEECLDFFMEHQRSAPMPRHFTRESLDWRFTFNAGDIRAHALLLRQHGGLRGLVYGYVNPVNEWDAYFSVDGVVTHPGLSPREKRAFISAMEAHMRDELGCFASMIPGTVCAEDLRWSGYITVKRYFFGSGLYENDLNLDPDTLSSLFVELR